MGKYYIRAKWKLNHVGFNCFHNVKSKQSLGLGLTQINWDWLNRRVQTNKANRASTEASAGVVMATVNCSAFDH